MTTFFALQCPVCGRPVEDPPPSACLSCGLPAVGQAAHVMARIGGTLRDLARERDALLQTLRAAAPGRVPPVGWTPPPGGRVPVAAPAPLAGWQPPSPRTPGAPPPAPRRRLSPQQVLLGLGAVLVVAAAITFVAVAWTRLGLAFQAGVMLTATAAACGVSAWTARRGLRATEEALAAAGAALLAIDLGAVRALGLFGLEEVPLRSWWAVSCAVVLLLATALGRGTRTTAVWPLAALLAAQPLPFLLLPDGALLGPAGVGLALALAAADLAAARSLRHDLAPVARVLTALAGGAGAAGGLAVALAGPLGESWTATALLAVAGAAAVAAASRSTDPVPRMPTVAATAAAVPGLALTGSLHLGSGSGAAVATGLGLALLTAAVPMAPRTAPAAGLTGGGAAMALLGAAFLADAADTRALALALLGATVPAAAAAVRLPGMRDPATGAALLAPALAVLVARADELLTAPVAGLLLALLAATAFGLAALRTGHAEETVCAAGGTVAGLLAGLTTAEVGAWGQVGMQLGIAGAAAGCYALASGRRWVGSLAVADLVVAAWVAVAGAGVQTPEAYTLPAALGLLVVALPRIRAGAPSWTAEGASAAVALVPSALVVVADPTALRLVLVVVAAVALTVAGTVLHRQAAFVTGSGVLLLVAIGRLGPYAPLLPRWLTLGVAGLLLLVAGATYERRRQQAREAVAWVAQMR